MSGRQPRLLKEKPPERFLLHLPAVKIQKHHLAVCTLCVVGWLSVHARVNAGELDRASTAVRGSSSSSSSSSSDSSSDDSSYNYDDDDGYYYGPVAGGASTLVGGAAAPPDPPTLFADYPYADNHPGHLIDPWSIPVPNQGAPQEFAVTAQTGFSATLKGPARVRGAVRVLFPGQFELGTSWSHYWETSGTEGVQQVTVGAANVSFRLIEAPSAVLRVGVGYRGWIDEVGHEAGVEGLFGVDIFPQSPWIFSLELRGGGVGEAGIFQARATVGIALDALELFAGYDQLLLFDGDGDIAADLGGPTLGVRYWF